MINKKDPLTKNKAKVKKQAMISTDIAGSFLRRLCSPVTRTLR
jgi:hypothetical protein